MAKQTVTSTAGRQVGAAEVDGSNDSFGVGAALSILLGFADVLGALLGDSVMTLGAALGEALESELGETEGLLLGLIDGSLEGVELGEVVGELEGDTEGFTVGFPLG